MNNYIISKKACNLIMNFLQAPEWNTEWVISNMMDNGILSVYGSTNKFIS